MAERNACPADSEQALPEGAAEPVSAATADKIGDGGAVKAWAGNFRALMCRYEVKQIKPGKRKIEHKKWWWGVDSNH